MKNKVEFYGPIQEEIGVIMAFSKLHEALGFTKLVPSKNRGFDIESIEYKGTNVTVEFEFKSSNFINHGHPEKMIAGHNYVVVCWEDDCGLVSLLRKDHGKELYDVIEIRNYVDVQKDNLTTTQGDQRKYIVLSYNPKNADGKDFGDWAFSHCYRVRTSPITPKFSQDSLPPGSKILYYRQGYIIGGCTVVRYEIIEKPNTKREWEIYKKLTDYPASLFTVDIEDYKEEYSRGHIFYTDFFDARDFKIKLSTYVNKTMPRQGKIDITKEEYYRITGK